MSNLSNPNMQAQADQPIPPEKYIQFRVMRLYKPPLFTTPSVPTFSPNPEVDPLSSGQLNADYVISPYILLPDSFGDIYTGETFSAYIAVVPSNFVDIPLYNVAISVKLTTTNASYDLIDIRPIPDTQSSVARILQSNDILDMVISHTLNELGTHTLRASVQFSINKFSEPITVRKLYRFNVLSPLTIKSSYTELKNQLMVQCQIANSSKASICIEYVKFVTHIRDATVVNIRDMNNDSSSKESKSDTLSTINIDKFYPYDMMYLTPNESFAAAFVITLPRDYMGSHRNIGYPEIKWSSSLGECGVLRGVETTSNVSSSSHVLMNNGAGGMTSQTHTMQDMKTVEITCNDYPKYAIVDQPFKINIRVYNNTKQGLNLRLHSQSPNENAPVDLENTGLYIINLSAIQLESLQSGVYLDKELTIYPLSTGLYELKDVVVIDSYGKEYTSGVLFKIMIYPDESAVI